MNFSFRLGAFFLIVFFLGLVYMYIQAVAGDLTLSIFCLTVLTGMTGGFLMFKGYQPAPRGGRFKTLRNLMSHTQDADKDS